MRSYDPSDEDDVITVREERIEPWMLECLARNPGYRGWGPYEDCMANEGGGWHGRCLFDTWSSFGPWGLDDLNECVNFYFYAERDSRDCKACEASGQNPETKRIADEFYDFDSTGRRWCDRLTEDEVDALWAQNRLRFHFSEKPLAEQVNAKERTRAGVHDAINRCILVETRAKRLGVWGACEHCQGQGSIYTSEAARLGLVLWMLHPRKGAARGVDVKNIRQDEVPAVLEWLRKAAERNAQRFECVSRP